MRSLFFIALTLASITGCNPYDPDLGPAPFLCGPPDQNPRCPDGYTCMSNGSGGEYCLAPMGQVPVDGNNSNCADDSSLEPNDSYMMAYQTPVAAQKAMVTFAGLAICPSGDKDTYGITITAANQNLEVIVEFEGGGATLQASILNGGGTPIANATMVTGMTGKIRASVPNLPTGSYYAQVYGPNMGGLTTNNYKIAVNVTGP